MDLLYLCSVGRHPKGLFPHREKTDTLCLFLFVPNIY